MPEDDGLDIIAHHRYIIRVIVIGWTTISVVLGLTAIAGGIALVVGPINAHTSPAGRFLDQFAGLDWAASWLMIVGAIPLLLRKFVIVGNLILGIAHGWWAFFILFVVYFLHQPSSLIAVAWVGAIMLIHFIAAGSRVAIWQYFRRTNSIRGAGDG